MATSVSACNSVLEEANILKSEVIKKTESTVLAAADSTNTVHVEVFEKFSYGPTPPTGEICYNTQMYQPNYLQNCISHQCNQVDSTYWQEYPNPEGRNQIYNIVHPTSDLEYSQIQNIKLTDEAPNILNLDSYQMYMYNSNSSNSVEFDNFNYGESSASMHVPVNINTNNVNDSYFLPDFDYKELESSLVNIKNEYQCNVNIPITDIETKTTITEGNKYYNKENCSPCPVHNNVDDDKVEYICNLCNKVFAKKCYLTQHNNYFHSAVEKKVKCTVCGKRFADKESCKAHTDKHNIGNKLHMCTLCPNRYNHRSDLRRHMYLHSDSKPYSCKECKMSFVRRDHLTKHMKKHGDTTVQK